MKIKLTIFENLNFTKPDNTFMNKCFIFLRYNNWYNGIRFCTSPRCYKVYSIATDKKNILWWQLFLVLCFGCELNETLKDVKKKLYTHCNFWSFNTKDHFFKFQLHLHYAIMQNNLKIYLKSDILFSSVSYEKDGCHDT